MLTVGAAKEGEAPHSAANRIMLKKEIIFIAPRKRPDSPSLFEQAGKLAQ